MLARPEVVDVKRGASWAPLGRKRAMRNWQSALMHHCKGKARALTLGWALHDLIGAAGFATVGDEALAGITSLDVRNVGHGLKDLERAGLIRRAKGKVMPSGWRQRLIHPTMPAGFEAPEWPLPDQTVDGLPAVSTGEPTGQDRREGDRLIATVAPTRRFQPDDKLLQEESLPCVDIGGREEGPASKPDPNDRTTREESARRAPALGAPRLADLLPAGCSYEPPPNEMPDAEPLEWWETLPEPEPARAWTPRPQPLPPLVRARDVAVGETDEGIW